MQKTPLIIGIIVIVAVVAGLGYYIMRPVEPVSPPVTENNNESIVQKTFTISAQNFSFSPAEIKVKQGERIKIILDNVDGFHDFVIDEFNVKTEQFQGPDTREIEFVADKAGTFEYYCSVGTHRQMGMKGNLIVE